MLFIESRPGMPFGWVGRRGLSCMQGGRPLLQEVNHGWWCGLVLRQPNTSPACTAPPFLSPFVLLLLLFPPLSSSSSSSLDKHIRSASVLWIRRDAVFFLLYVLFRSCIVCRLDADWWYVNNPMSLRCSFRQVQFGSRAQVILTVTYLKHAGSPEKVRP